MENKPIIIERTYNASPERIWKALTDTREMKEWYFDIKEFKAEPGWKFDFYEPGGTKFHHLCEVKESIPNKKISYTWKYEFDPGVTLVSFELFPDGEETRVVLTHSGIENFSKDNPDLKRKNFVQGWTEILGINLKKFLEK